MCPAVPPGPTLVDLVVGVENPLRLQAVAAADLHGHLGDADLDAIVGTLNLACAAPLAVINIVTPSLQTYPAEVGVGADCTDVPDEVSFCAEVVNTGRALTVCDAAHHPVYSRNPLVMAGRVGAYAGFPLVENDVVFGTVAIFDTCARDFSTDDVKVLRYQSALAGSVLTLRRRATTDALTGLANRERLLYRLSSAIARLDRHPGMACVLYVDVDDFKSINDRYGHAAGDSVLVEVAHRLLTATRPTDIVARLGGDEFAAVCEDLRDVDDAEALIARVKEVLSEDWWVNGQRLLVAVSIGCALTASPATVPATLLRAADSAMYRAKSLPGVRSDVVVEGAAMLRSR